jgi:hypothetical protein
VFCLLREKHPQTFRTSRPGVTEQKSRKNGTVPHPAASVWMSCQFLSGGGVEKGGEV